MKGCSSLPYRIDYQPEAEEHLASLTARQRALVLDGVDAHLQHQPTVETRNRKLRRPNALADWELRIENLRVFYKVEEEPEQLVRIRATGVKVGNEVFLAGEKWEEP